MPQVINTNIMSLNAQRNLNMSQGSLATSLERLSSGLRINSAKDDAAGLAVAQGMLSQVKSLNQAVRNANDAISMLQTAEGGMQEVQTMLQRMRELAVQASSDSISDTERGYINTELQDLKNEINNIGDRTKFSGQQVLTGALSTTLAGATGADLVVGDQFGTVVASAIDVSGAKVSETYTFTGDTTADTLTLTRSSDSVAQTISVGAIAANGSAEINFSQLGVSVTLLADSSGEAADDIIGGLTAAANDTIITGAGSGSATFQVGADATGANQVTLSFSDARINATGGMSALNTSLGAFNGSSTSTNAQALLADVDTAVDYISGKRAELGAKMNRLDSTVANLQVTSENLSASRSRIVDADFAAETAELTRTQILQQAGVAMLAQANTAPQNVLALLQ